MQKAKKVLQKRSLAACRCHAKQEIWVWSKPQLTDLCEGQRRYQPFLRRAGTGHFQFQGKVDLKNSFLSPAKSSSATPNAHQHFLLALRLSGFSAKRIQLVSEADHSTSTDNSSCSQTQADITVHFRPYLRSTGFFYQLLRSQTYFQMQADSQALHLRDDPELGVTQEKRGPYLSSES